MFYTQILLVCVYFLVYFCVYIFTRVFHVCFVVEFACNMANFHPWNTRVMLQCLWPVLQPLPQNTCCYIEFDFYWYDNNRNPK